MNLLILSCGTRDKVVQYFKKAFAGEGRIICTDASPYAPALYEGDAHYIVPRITEPGYMDIILDICRKEKITGVLSLIDPELSLIALHKNEFEALGTTVIGSSYELCERTLNKWALYQWMCEHGYACAKSYIDLEAFYQALEAGEVQYPVFVKPMKGSASLHIAKAEDKETVELLYHHGEQMMIQEFMDDFLGLYISPKNRLMNSLLIGPGLPGGMMGSLMSDLEKNLETINKSNIKNNKPLMSQDQLLIKLFDEVAYVWPRVGYPPLVTPFSQYVKNLALMNVMQMEKGKARWSMIADDIWDMILGKAGRLPGPLAPEIIEKAKAEGRKFFEGNPQDNYPDALDKYRKLMNEKQWETGEDDEELFEYAMHPAQYEAYRSGKAKVEFKADVAKRKAEKQTVAQPAVSAPATPASVTMAMPTTPQVMTVDVNGQAYKVTVAFGDTANTATLAETPAAPAATPAPAAAPAGTGKEVLSPLEGKFFLVKGASDTPVKVGDVVKEGDVLCYVEAMKTYNAVRAEFGGTVTAICLASGDAVSEDDVLMTIQ